jgi:hypothetical protein
LCADGFDRCQWKGLCWNGSRLGSEATNWSCADAVQPELACVDLKGDSAVSAAMYSLCFKI